MQYDAIVIGAGLAGLVATAEIADAGKKVLLLDQEPEQSMGGQAWWSFGGLFLVDSPEQRRLGIKDSKELAWQDWLGTAGFDRLDDEDYWAIKWAEKYVDFAAGEKRAWLYNMGVRFFLLLVGLNGVVPLPMDMVILYLDSISHGEQALELLNLLNVAHGNI